MLNIKPVDQACEHIYAYALAHLSKKLEALKTYTSLLNILASENQNLT